MTKYDKSGNALLQKFGYIVNTGDYPSPRGEITYDEFDESIKFQNISPATREDWDAQIAFLKENGFHFSDNPGTYFGKVVIE